VPRIARVVVPGVPYHIIGRGNHRQDVFLTEADKLLYLRLLDEYGEKFGVTFIGFCLMDNHHHLSAVPEFVTSFAKCFAEVNRRYSTIINIRESWSGNMWQGRYQSFPMDEAYLYNAVRYIERNPVRAGIVKKAWDYKWSSAWEHISGKRGSILRLADIKRYLNVPDWKAYLEQEDPPDLQAQIELHGRTGRPLGSKEFVEKLEKLTGRNLAPRPTRMKQTASILLPGFSKDESLA
jgi:putative transposase